MSLYVQVWAPNHPKASSSGMVYGHVLVAEAALGHYLPDKANIHHVDDHQRNNANNNLVICQDMAYHKLLHLRRRVLRAGGDPNTQRICATCRALKVFCEFNRLRANHADGLQRRCKACQRTWTLTNRNYLNTKQQERRRRIAGGA